MNRTELLEQARRLVAEDRNATHGEPEDSFRAIAELWTAYLRACAPDLLKALQLEPADVAVMMALLKIARITNNPRNADNWVDLAGYAACGVEVAQAQKYANRLAPATTASGVPPEAFGEAIAAGAKREASRTRP